LREFAIVFKLGLCFEEKFLSAEYIAIFETSEDYEEAFKTSKFVKMNAPAIAFPFLRSYIAHITLIAGYNPVVLPSVNFVELSRSGEVSSRDEKAAAAE
jgi:preprotein translocase subunit SecB